MATNMFDGLHDCRTLAIDPPWTPDLGATWETRFTDKARPQKHYDTMRLADIYALPIGEIAAKQSHLWLWCLSQHIDWGYEAVRAWGFEPVITCTWCKPGRGVGRFQCNTEQFIIARKGSRHGNPFGPTNGTWFTWPRGQHSEKPYEFYDLVRQCSPGPYTELFARRERAGWTTWGDQVDLLPRRDTLWEIPA